MTLPQLNFSQQSNQTKQHYNVKHHVIVMQNKIGIIHAIILKW